MDDAAKSYSTIFERTRGGEETKDEDEDEGDDNDNDNNNNGGCCFWVDSLDRQ